MSKPDRDRRTFASASQVLAALSGRLGLDRRLREHAVMSMWPSLVNEQIASRTRPLYIDAEGNLVVAASDGACAQEVSLMRSGLIGKLASVSAAIGVNVRGLRVDLKHYREAEPQPVLPDKQPQPPGQEELAKLVLSQDDKQGLAELERELARAPGISLQLRERMLRLYERSLRLSVWCAAHGYAVCRLCRRPLGSSKQEAVSKALCASCLTTNM
jgi:hypothetical protein